MFETLTAPPPDGILALAQAYKADPRERKLDLGVGVYKDEAGATPIMRAVKEAERRILEGQETKAYIGPAGDETFNKAMAELVFGDAVAPERVAGLQSVGGTGAVRVLCDLIARADRGAKVWMSDPTWANHGPIIKAAGLGFTTYPYFDSETRGVRFDAMMAALSAAGPGDVVLLHGCCHNPTGANLTLEQWGALTDLTLKQGFTPFIDMAYQGFGDGLAADAAGVRLMAARVPEMLLAASCSKNFALYRDRVGCALAIAPDAASAGVAKETLKGVARTNHSMPPDHGAAVVRTILGDPALRADWEAELESMRLRMLDVRQKLAEALRARTNSDDFDFVADHRGMFSRLEIPREAVEKMRETHGVYMVGDSRINIAGLNAASIEMLVAAVAETAA
jgi:aromatic-amino-acid transaminase